MSERARPLFDVAPSSDVAFFFPLLPPPSGRLLASFRSGFSQLVPDGASEVYVKKNKASGAPAV